MIEGFEETLEIFMILWEEKVRKNYIKSFGNDELFKGLERNTRGRKYVKLISDGSVCAFIEKNTGDIYKPASWKAPAKHVRGNIFSKEGGFEAIGNSFIFSINYMR